MNGRGVWRRWCAALALFIAALGVVVQAPSTAQHVGTGVGPTHHHGKPPVTPPLSGPVLTQTSTPGTNPPTWQSVISGLLDNDTIQLDFTSNGANPDGTAEESQVVDAAQEGLTWSTFTGFAGGATVKWQMRYGRDPGTGFVWSGWSNILSDVMNAPWAPSNLATAPVHWWKVKDATTVTVDGSTNIQQLNDKGSAGANAAQATAGSRPAYIASGINGFAIARESSAKGLTFTSSMTSLSSVQFGSGLPDTVIVTLDGTDQSSGAVFNSLTSNNMIEVVWTAGAGTGTVTFYQNGTQKAQLTGKTIANAGAIFIIGKYNNGGNLSAGRLITNGVLLNRTDLQRYISGDVGEWIYLNYAPTTTEREHVEGYDMWDWGMPTSLPSGHTYRNAAP